MRLLLWPMCSQQDKMLGKFRLASDSGVKMLAYIASRAAGIGWQPELLLPQEHQCCDAVQAPSVLRLPYTASLDNRLRRMQWQPEFISTLSRFDAVVLTDECKAYPIRCLCPGVRIAVECGDDVSYRPSAELYKLSWRCADLVFCSSSILAARHPHSSVWQFAYDDEVARVRGLARDVDVLFNARCSVDNYTHHSVALEAWPTATFTDPTSYLTGRPPLDRERYVELLHRSRVVLGLTNNGYGGYSFVEAVAAGACPAALRCREYTDLLTEQWPYLANSLDPAEVRRAVRAALDSGWWGVPVDVVSEVLKRLKRRSYSSAWEVARGDLEALQ